MNINGYLNEIRGLDSSGMATEHDYRPALEGLFKSVDGGLAVMNEIRQRVINGLHAPVAVASNRTYVA